MSWRVTEVIGAAEARLGRTMRVPVTMTSPPLDACGVPLIAAERVCAASALIDASLLSFWVVPSCAAVDPTCCAAAGATSIREAAESANHDADCWILMRSPLHPGRWDAG